MRAEQPQHGQQGGSGAEGAEHAQSAEYLSDSELEEGPVGRREQGVRRALQVRWWLSMLSGVGVAQMSRLDGWQRRWKTAS